MPAEENNELYQASIHQSSTSCRSSPKLLAFGDMLILLGTGTKWPGGDPASKDGLASVSDSGLVSSNLVLSRKPPLHEAAREREDSKADPFARPPFPLLTGVMLSMLGNLCMDDDADDIPDGGGGGDDDDNDDTGISLEAGPGLVSIAAASAA